MKKVRTFSKYDELFIIFVILLKIATISCLDQRILNKRFIRSITRAEGGYRYGCCFIDIFCATRCIEAQGELVPGGGGSMQRRSYNSQNMQPETQALPFNHRIQHRIRHLRQKLAQRPRSRMFNLLRQGSRNGMQPIIIILF